MTQATRGYETEKKRNVKNTFKEQWYSISYELRNHNKHITPTEFMAGTKFRNAT